MKKSQKGFTLTELLVVITIIGILAGLLMTSLARGKAKAYRISCVSNIGNVYKAGLMFGQDNGERLPWQLTKPGVRNHFKNLAASNTYKYGAPIIDESNEVKVHKRSLHAAGCFGIGAMKNELVTPKILHSPCDASRKVFNIALEEKWKDINTKSGGASKDLGDGASYCLIRGADTLRPTSIYSITRNWASPGGANGNVWLSGNVSGFQKPGGIINNGRWQGNDDNNVADKSRVMAGLSGSQGQLVTMDGGARQSQDSDLGVSGALVNPALEATGGVAKGKTSTAVIRGKGL